MKSLLIKDLELNTELNSKDLAAVRGGIAVGGCFPSLPAVPLNGDPNAMIEAFAALVPAYAPMNPFPGQVVTL